MWHYFDNKLSAGFVSLYVGRTLQFAANGVIGLFLPVYLLIQFNYRVSWVLLWYLVGHLLYAFILPFSVHLLNRFGMRRSLRVSVFADALYLASIFLIAKNLPLFVVLSLVLATIARLTFWLPYHVDFAKFTDARDRGRDVSIIWATKSFLGIVMPIASGFLITYFDFSFVFVIAIILYITPIIPFMALPRTREKFEWTVWETIKRFFNKKNRSLVVSNMANGAENAVTLIIWPVFIWQLLKGNYVAVGVLSSIIVFIGVILQLAAGRFTDHLNKRRLLHWGSIFYAFGWLAKVFVLTGFHIFIAGAYHQFAKIFKDTPFDTLNYELLADQGHYVDEYTVLKEMAVNLGKVIMLLFAILVAFNFGVNWTFALAALASLLVNFL